ncbi:MAG TPA: ATP-dependent DNA helicase UvrD2 [Candidatus Eisenbacteria bacterium]|nr:ATP-dependent DNA helicase UvrD2 [Candidatus Eisenbacteria bacterium]
MSDERSHRTNELAAPAALPSTSRQGSRDGAEPAGQERFVLGRERLLTDLNEAQRTAVSITEGPLAIIAGAGSGKTRVISHRAAYAIETGVVAADRILLVTFTDKAATEMVARMRALGHPRVMARTFHAFALAQLRHFWPSRHEGEPLPQLLDSKTEILFRLARGLPGHYRFAAPRDLAEAIEWAKVRRIPPARWEQDGRDRAPIPTDLFSRLYANYERTKDRAGRIDFEDMLIRTVDLLEGDEDAAETVRARKTWISVDEYQDTNPLAERLLELWLGTSRDLAVVGDPDQTIYTFTGATPDYLLNFEARHPGARTVALVENYRSTPQILELANRLTVPGPRGALRTANAAGPAPAIRRHPDDATERRAIVEAIRGLLGEGTDPAEIAILVRINAQLPDLEQALTRAGIPFRVRGQRFFERREVRDARQLLRRSPPEATGADIVDATRRLFTERLGLVDPEFVGTGAEDRGTGARTRDGASDPTGDEARERTASLEILIEIVRDLAGADPTLATADVLAELDRRDAEEAAGAGSGVNLLTYHRAKGLEWDAVFLPALEEGLLPIRQAKDDAAIAEERRLLYVGITRARRRLTLSWAHRRIGTAGTEVQRKPSRFLALLEPRPERAWRVGAQLNSARSDGPSGAGDRAWPDGPWPNGASSQGTGSGSGDQPSAERRSVAAFIAAVEAPDADGLDRHLLEALQLWRRERAARDGVPAYVVAHDAALFAIAEAEPRTLTALGQVRGMGPVKLERYGSEILAITARRDASAP